MKETIYREEEKAVAEAMEETSQYNKNEREITERKEDQVECDGDLDSVFKHVHTYTYKYTSSHLKGLYRVKF